MGSICAGGINLLVFEEPNWNFLLLVWLQVDDGGGSDDDDDDDDDWLGGKVIGGYRNYWMRFSPVLVSK